jgi:hypothetical protein
VKGALGLPDLVCNASLWRQLAIGNNFDPGNAMIASEITWKQCSCLNELQERGRGVRSTLSIVVRDKQ